MGFSRQGYWGGFQFLLQGVVLIQGSNLGLLHYRHILSQLSYQGSSQTQATCLQSWHISIPLCLPWKRGQTLTCFLLTISSFLLCRGVHPELRRQHVHEDHHAHGHAHRGRGRVLPLHVPASLRAAGGHHLQGLCRHPAFGAGRGACQAHG